MAYLGGFTMTTYRGWRVFGSPANGGFTAIKGRERVTAPSAVSLRVVIDQRELAMARAAGTGAAVFDTGPL